MSEGAQSELDLFHEVLDQPPEDRDAFIVDRHAEDPELIDRLRRLVAGHERAERAGADRPLVPVEATPERIGPYRLQELLGEGGMGVVYAAEQVEPIRRRVAVKIIKLGMDTKEVIARFEAERQALAMLDHPGVARVFDAGSTTNGRPYFVMELVRGLPLNEYCAKHKVTVRTRLQLFVQVCDAVHHAHQKGIIHRDIKPSNVLVTVPEERPVPKIIDFGVMKATAARLSERTVFTEQGQLIGTPEYMSPEQAEMSGLDVDTRTDVYSLGVMLYELLTGVLPFDSRQLRSGGFAEIQRIIREVEPTRPSARIAELARDGVVDRAQAAAAHRMVRGDLDRVVMCAMDKDRTRRYGSASALGEDVARFLADLPVRASTPSAAYRLQKFIKRQRYLATAIAFTFLAVIAGVAGLAIGLIDAREAEALADRRADNAQVASAFLQRVLFHVDPEFGGGKLSLLEVMGIASRSVDDDLSDHPEVEASVRESIGVAYRRLSMFAEAEPHLRQSLEIRRQLLGDEDLQTARSFIATAYLMFEHEGSIDEALELLAKASRSLAVHGLTESPINGWLLLDIGIINLAGDHLGAAQRAFEGSSRMLTARRGAEHPDVSRPLRGLAMVALHRGDLEEAERLARDAVSRCEGEGTEYIGARARLVLARVLIDREKLEEAGELLSEAATRFARTVGTRHIRMAELDALLSRLALAQGEFTEAERFAKRCESLRRELLHPRHWGLLEARLLRQRARLGMGLAEDADSELLAIGEEAERRVGPDHPLTIAVARARLECANVLDDASLKTIRSDRLVRLEAKRAKRLASE